LEYQWLAAEAKGRVVTAYIDEETGLVENVEFFLDVQNANAPTAAFTYEDQGDGSIVFTDESGNEPLSWQWTFGDGKTSSDQNPVHEYTGSGDYNVCLTAANIVGSNQVCQQITVEVPNNALDPALRVGISVYPNPADQYLNIVPEGLEHTSFEFTLFDLQGKPLQQIRFTGQTRLNMSEFPSGLYSYFLRTQEGSKWDSGKIQISR
jgi:PKD repeat protein